MSEITNTNYQELELKEQANELGLDLQHDDDGT